ncbi:hypothetical protein DUNSADRAFT_13269 [Dunaliella salina]|uniref:Encoded protein n=1 Tax=Dunaliella salina TaxID=3046 RepID=A0ABQ7G9P4_DUNSA|nr:hypothetical protein DUNSADRAFT_13269 [Dunaliella salina]|eukprot:KAF5831330.1 hypothetical protein DUNSADRAFT_13269 [Dunaliella salina]
MRTEHLAYPCSALLLSSSSSSSNSSSSIPSSRGSSSSSIKSSMSMGNSRSMTFSEQQHCNLSAPHKQAAIEEGGEEEQAKNLLWGLEREPPWKISAFEARHIPPRHL